MSGEPPAGGAPRRRWRARPRALLALLLTVLAAPVAAELLLRWRPLRVPALLAAPAPGRLSPARAGFVPFDVAARPDRPRVLYVGASTEAGYPFGPGASLAAWVQRVLAWRGADVEVVPVACAGLDAGDTLDLFPELFALAPAAIVVGVGQNEFLHTERLLDTRWWRRLELVRRLSTALAGDDEVRDVLVPTVEVDFDRARMLDALGASLDALAALADARRVPLLFTVPASNLADFPPVLGNDPRIPEDADTAFDRGRARLAEGDVAGARTALLAARDRDRWPHRAPAPIVAALAARPRAVRTDLAVEAIAAHGLPGDDVFLDHCHPAPAGARAIAVAVADALEGFALFPPTGKLGEAPPLAELLAAAGLSADDVARARADVARALAGYALMTRHHGRLAETADRRLASLDAAYADAGEVESLRALLALQRGDVAAAQQRFDRMRRTQPAAFAGLLAEDRRFPWIRELLDDSGLALPGAGGP